MNPSTLGWVKKFGHIIEKQELLVTDDMALFMELTSYGFTYGTPVFIPDFVITEHKSSLDEKAKINLLYGLYVLYKNAHKTNGFSDFISCLASFYEQIEPIKKNQFSGLLGHHSLFEKIEKQIDQRVFMPTHFLNKSLGNKSLNNYLFIDLLCFKRFLSQEENALIFLKSLEALALEVTQKTLLFIQQSKQQETVAPSLEESKVMATRFVNSKHNIPLDAYETEYFISVACLNSFQSEDQINIQALLIEKISTWFGVETSAVFEIRSQISSFLNQHKKQLPSYKESHLGEQIYENLYMLMNKLIMRNSKRLLKELKGSQELLVLLSKSTHKELNETEKKKIQEQSLDIIKAIPSLAIFILPGGAILLPIFIKLIPKLLPSAFDDNRIQ